jgi:hypothetical protein
MPHGLHVSEPPDEAALFTRHLMDEQFLKVIIFKPGRLKIDIFILTFSHI